MGERPSERERVRKRERVLVYEADDTLTCRCTDHRLQKTIYLFSFPGKNIDTQYL